MTKVPKVSWQTAMGLQPKAKVATLRMRTGRPTRPGTMPLFVVILLVIAGGAHAARPAPSDQDAQRAHAQGSCGKLGPGTGLKNGKGWVASMLPGRHEFRVRGGGNVYLTAARQLRAVDFDAGRLYFISIENASPGTVLEWKIPGSEWGPVSTYFLYPPKD